MHNLDNPPPSPENPTAAGGQTLTVKVFGVGRAGVKVMENLIGSDVGPATFTAVITDAESIAATSACSRINLETRLLRGLGTGGDPDRGRGVAEEAFDRLKGSCEGADVVFIIAGLGGGAGTGISPVLARAAKEAGALVLGFVTLPFEIEGNLRERLARKGLEEMKAAADGVICLPNERMSKVIDENMTLVDTFQTTNTMLADGVRGLWRLLTHHGLIDIHFSDLCELIRDHHAESAFAMVESTGPNRAREAAEKLLSHPLLDDGRLVKEADTILINVVGGPDLTMADVNRVVQGMGKESEQAQVMLGAAVDPAFAGRLSVTVIACHKGREAGNFVMKGTGEELGSQFLSRSEPPRHGSRFVPPPPPLSAEQMQRLASRQGGIKGRKSQRLRQGQLPLEAVSKGRFDKSEPTIHKGEDLDVPTYIRRGICLNLN